MKTPAELLPHKDPMIFISDIRSFDLKNGFLIAHVKIKQSDILFQSNIGGVPSYAALEYMAQSVGCFVGLYDLEKNPNNKPAVGFVLGSRRLQINVPVFKLDEDYLVKVNMLFCDETIASFECLMYNENTDEQVASAIVNVYRPESVSAFIKEYT